MTAISAQNQTIEPSKLLRWTILLLVSVTIGTNYYVYDAMSSIKSIMQSQLGFSNTDYGILVGIYSFPNLIMSVVGGIVLDKWGIKKTGLLFVILCVLGALLSAYGSSPYFHNGGLSHGLFSTIAAGFQSIFGSKFTPELTILIFGRLLFGLGAETSIVVINKVLVKWFQGKELSLAFSLNIAIARIGTLLALWISPIYSENPSNWYWALWIAAILMCVGLVTFLIYIMYDVKYSPKNDLSGKLQEDEIFRMKDIFDLLTNKSFIYVCLLCVTFYSAVFPFQSYCPDLLHNKFGVSIEMSGRLTGLIVTGTILFTPLFGFLIDKIGKRASLMILGSFLLILTHLTLAFTNLTPYLSMFILGMAFSLVPAAMWPAVAMIVEEKKLGTAFGVMGSIQNIGLWLVPTIAGNILDATNQNVAPGGILNYTPQLLLFVGLGVFALAFALLLKKNEAGPNSHGLEKPNL